MNTSEKIVDLPEDDTSLSDNRSTGNKGVKVVTTDMPIAIAIMILFILTLPERESIIRLYDKQLVRYIA